MSTTTTKSRHKIGDLIRRPRHGYYMFGLDAWICPDGYDGSTPTSWRVEWRAIGDESPMRNRDYFRRLADARAFAATIVDAVAPREWSN
jgi:hypothetical protein